MNRTKNQHYVPHLLLRHFGWEEKKGKPKINIFDMLRSDVRHNQLAKENFAENNFYDKDNRVEKFLSEEIESPASKVIDEIVRENYNVIKDEAKSLVLIRFISSLLYRTPEAKEKALGFINSAIEPIVQELLSLNGFNPEEASKGKFDFQDPSQLISELTLDAIIDSVLIKDLVFHIIKNESKLKFCISDHPVFTYNWLYRNLEHPGVTGITARGLQIFLPLSPNLTLCLYDREVYKYGQKGSLLTCTSNVSDIEILNSFQIINSNSIIGFHSKDMELPLKKLYEQNKKVKLYQHESEVLNRTNDEKGKIKTTNLVFTRQTKLRKMPSFVNVKRKANHYATTFQERDPALSEKHITAKMILNQKYSNLEKSATI